MSRTLGCWLRRVQRFRRFLHRSSPTPPTMPTISTTPAPPIAHQSILEEPQIDQQLWGSFATSYASTPTGDPTVYMPRVPRHRVRTRRRLCDYYGEEGAMRGQKMDKHIIRQDRRTCRRGRQCIVLPRSIQSCWRCCRECSSDARRATMGWDPTDTGVTNSLHC